MGKCVSDSAVCFERYQCNYQGFVCKSDLTECAEQYDSLLARFNTLVGDYNALLETGRELQLSLETTLNDLEQARDTVRIVRDDLFDTQAKLDDLRTCIQGVDAAEDPTVCLY